MKICVLTAGGQGSEACLFYIAWTTEKHESASFLRQQLRVLHLHIISAGTRAIVQHFHNNPSYDLVNDEKLCFKVPALREYCNYLWQDPSCILNLYLPMRLHPMTRHAVNQIISRHKPTKDEPTEDNMEFDPNDSTPKGPIEDVQQALT